MSVVIFLCIHNEQNEYVILEKTKFVKNLKLSSVEPRWS